MENYWKLEENRKKWKKVENYKVEKSGNFLIISGKNGKT